MDFNITDHLPEDFHPNSRVWIYQSSRLFTIQEAFALEDVLNNFINNWKSHGAPVKGWANVFFGQFIIVMADESAVGVGGCSTDSSVHIIKGIEQQFGVNMFDRQSLAFFIKDKVQLLPLSQFEYGVQNNFINPETLYFNNTVLTKQQLVDKWIIPVKDSWLSSKLPAASA